MLCIYINEIIRVVKHNKMDIISSIIEFILQPYIWLPIVAVLLYLGLKNYQKSSVVVTDKDVDSVLLVLEIPRTNDKKESGR